MHTATQRPTPKRRVGAAAVGTLACTAAALLTLAACSASNDLPAPGVHATDAGAPASTAPPVERYVNPDWGFAIDLPRGWIAKPGFSGSAPVNQGWHTFAAPDSDGVAIVALVMPHSNHVTAAEIRIGASRDATALAHCLRAPLSETTTTQDIAGATFARFAAADAAMNHHLHVQGYRAVHAGACYAIDLVVFGSNPQLYDPPAKPPFSDTAAFARMRELLASFRFTGSPAPRPPRDSAR